MSGQAAGGYSPAWHVDYSVHLTCGLPRDLARQPQVVGGPPSPIRKVRERLTLGRMDGYIGVGYGGDALCPVGGRASPAHACAAERAAAAVRTEARRSALRVILAAAMGHVHLGREGAQRGTLVAGSSHKEESGRQRTSQGARRTTAGGTRWRERLSCALSRH